MVLAWCWYGVGMAFVLVSVCPRNGIGKAFGRGWYGLGVVLAWYWHGIGIVLDWYWRCVGGSKGVEAAWLVWYW